MFRYKITETLVDSYHHSTAPVTTAPGKLQGSVNGGMWEDIANSGTARSGQILNIANAFAP